jgi:septum formation protein
VATRPLILASSSPRRRELLAAAGVRFEVIPSPLEEPRHRPAVILPREWAESLAYFKARAVAELHPDRWVLAADTIVACDGELLGKPAEANDARRMLERQAGRASDVITGVCIARIAGDVHRILAAAVTRVWMRDDRREREAYLISGEWAGKAGAYGIQDVGDRLVERIEGDFDNVVGLPVELARRMLALAACDRAEARIDGKS